MRTPAHSLCEPQQRLHPCAASRRPRAATGEARFQFGGIPTLFGIAPWGVLYGTQHLAVVRRYRPANPFANPFPLAFRPRSCTRTEEMGSREYAVHRAGKTLSDFGVEMRRTERGGVAVLLFVRAWDLLV
jgi:hypothetical protein